MKQTINFCQFCDAFRNMNRDNNFSYEGKRALFDYLENLEQEQGQEIELDIIALCCEYNEIEPENIQNEYKDIGSIEDLRNQTQVIEVSNGNIIYANF